VLIDEPAGVADVVAAARAAGEVALDLEFAADGRLRPELALVQLAWRDGAKVRAVAIDAVATDATAAIALVGEVDVILHAGRQDLQLLATRFDRRGRRIFDTQIAAAFAGLGDQLGYAKLAEQLVGARIDKDLQFTDWLARPLTARQLDYALDDVRHLPAAADVLKAQLAELGRDAWVAAECDALCEVAYAAGRTGADDAWADVGGARKLRGVDRAAIVRLAAWRWRIALERNKPPSWIVADKALVELAQRRPRDADELKKIRGAGEVARERGDELLAELALAVADAEAAGADAGVGAGRGQPSSPRAQLWEQVFVTLVQWAAERARLPARWLASRGDCEDVARWLDRGDPRADAHPLFTTWRREVVGDTLRAWVRGELALVGDAASAAGARLVPVPGAPGRG
jgi:ribonuclease D